MKITIGKDTSGHNIYLDLENLIKTRLLIQANSGGGKSWLLRRIAEEVFGTMPVIIIDPEGEFPTLREKFGFVLVGKGGETPADPRSAQLVCHKLLELRASAVIDLYDMNPRDRHNYVNLFCQAAIDAPKKLWRPTLFIIDEVHLFAPESGKGKSEASEAVIGFPTRGRKRQFACVFATQRLAKVRKDATAEIRNRLIGQTYEADDLKSAAEQLGISGKDELAQFKKEMKLLEPGIFYGLGSAICREVTRIKVGDVQTSHEVQNAVHGVDAPPTPEKIKHLLPQLADLPKMAEVKAKTESELRQEIAELKRQLAQRPAAAPPEVKIVERSVFKDGELPALQNAAQVVLDAVKAAGLVNEPVLQDYSKPKNFWPEEVYKRQDKIVEQSYKDSGVKLGGPHKKFLTVLAMYPQGRSDEQIAVLCRLKFGTGHFNNVRSALVGQGMITGEKDCRQITPAGLEWLGPFKPLPTGQELQRYWLDKLPQPAAKLLRVFIEEWPKAVAIDEAQSYAGFTPLTGHANNQVSALRTRELIVDVTRGTAKASDELFD